MHLQQAFASMIGGLVHGAANVIAEAQREAQRDVLRAEEKARRHLLKQQQRAQAAQAHAQPLTEEQKRLAKARKAAAVEEAQQGGEGAEGFVAGAAGRDEDEVELYSNYQPGRVREGKPHPDPIVETASLAGVAPPEPTYLHHLHDCVAQGQLSNCQLETVIYAFMRFEKRLPNGNRAGFFLGDGAGVGKGRQIAAIIKEEHKRSGPTTRALWLSVSNDLRYDAVRDLSDVGAKDIKVFPEGSSSLPKGPVEKHHKTGVMFLTYSLLIAGLKKGNLHSVDEQNTAITTSSDALPTPDDLGVNKDSRLAQIVNWLRGRDGQGECLIILDECHKAKNLIAKEGQITQTGKAVGILQDLLPNARVLYSSATGASEPNNLGYMYRLGAAGFDHMKEMIDTLTKSGLGAMELFAMGLKATGSYLSRTLSYKGADFEIAKMDIAPEFGVMYDRSSDLWQMLFHICSGLGPGLKRSFWGQFFSGQMRFYRQMLMAAKVRGCADLANKAVEEGMCVVIGLQSTGEANTNQLRDEQGDDLEDFISAPKQILHQFLSKHFPLNSCDMTGYELDILQHQVSQAVDAWRVMPTAAQAAVSPGGANSLRPTQGLTAAIPGPANMPRCAPTMPRSPAAASSSATAASSAKAAAKPADDDSDDGLEVVGEQSLDEVMEAKRLHAERTGQMIDLTKNTDPEEVVRTARRLEEESKQAEEAEAAAKLQKLLEPLQLRVAQAQADLDEAHAALKAEEGQEASTSGAGSSPAGAPIKSEGTQSGTKRRSPLQPASQPTAKKGRLQLKRENSDEQSDPDFMADDSSPAPKRKPAGRASRLLESDEDCSQTSPIQGSAVKAETSEIDLTEDTACEVCRRTDNADDMLLCDSCDRGYHLACLSPRMEAIPEGDWFCPNCPTTKLQPSPKAKAAQQAVSEESDTDAEDFQPVPRKTTARQTSLLNIFAAQDRSNPNPKVRLLALTRKVRSAEMCLDTAKDDLQKAKDRVKQDQERKESRKKAFKQASATTEATPAHAKAVRVKPEPGSAAAASSARRPPTTGRKSVAKRGGGRDGYAVATDVLEDDWQEEYERGGEEEEAPEEICPQMVRIRDMLLRLLGIVELPPNPLDQLTDLMGGEDKVAEMTGRKGLLVRQDDGSVRYEKRLRDEHVSQKLINMREKEAFMAGRKHIAIISDAASVGISLQSDKRVGNQRRRCHLTLELPWSADKAIQQFGRSHRSNQASAPIYRIVVTDCAGEYRFASSAAKRLQSLGALLSADRRALGAGEDLKTFDVDNKWGRRALERILNDVIGNNDAMPGIQVPRLPDALKDLGADGGWPYRVSNGQRAGQDFYRYMRTALTAVGLINKQDHPTGAVYTVLEKNKKVTKFLNRMLAMGLRDQKLLFAYFSDTLDAIIEEAKNKGQYEHGIVNLQAQSINTISRELLHVDPSSDARTYYSRMRTVHGVDWESAKQYRDEYIREKTERGVNPDSLRKNGFYLSTTTSNQGQTGHTWILLATAVRKNSVRGAQYYRIQRPNNNNCADMQESSMLQGFRKINDAKAKETWTFWYEHLKTGCVHAKSCGRRRRGEECYIGTSSTTIHVIHGAVLPIWKVLADTVLPDEDKKSTGTKKEQAHVVRLQLDSGERVVGLSLQHDDVSRVLGCVEEKYGEVQESLQIQDTAAWDAENKLREQRKANAAAGISSRGTTPAKGLPQQPAQRRQLRYDAEIIELD